mgnify:CR=1 FL=1
MGFQDNSGDIILDVVLTDEGRRRLAKGDSSFSIVKFALGDDEINYALFNTGSTTALQDLSILQTPILEAFTNNTSLMKSKLRWTADSDRSFLLMEQQFLVLVSTMTSLRHTASQGLLVIHLSIDHHKMN